MKKRIVALLVVAMTMATFVWYGCSKDESEVVKGSIYGTVTDFATGQPVGNASVKLRPNGSTTLTGSDGAYEFKELEAGKYSLLLSKAEYADLDDDYIIAVESGRKVKRDVQMRKKIASLKITDMNGNPLDTLDFGEEESVTVRTFNIFNDGTENMDCSATYESDWIVSVTGLENTIQPGQTKAVTVRIDRVALSDGVNTTFINVTSGNGSNELVVKATFRGTAVITTQEPTSVTATSATVGGNISDDGGRPVTVRGICYGTSQTPTIDGDHTEDGSGTGEFSHNITGLASSTTYYARAYATNRNGTYYASNIVSFTTADGLPTVTTADISDITATTAKSGGNVTNNGGFNVTARGICWNMMGSPDLNDLHTANGSGNGAFTSNMTGLQIGISYYVRAYATNQAGTTYGEEKTFTTPDGLVSITLGTPQNVTANSATCSVTISDDGGVSVVQRGICWATTQYPDNTGDHIDVGMGSGDFNATINNLQPSTTYYVRAYAVNQAGTHYSAQQSFTTTDGLPVLTTATVSNITATTAQCGGTITSDGGFSVSARGICWNTMGNPDTESDHTSNGTGSGSFTANMTGLTPGVTYHVRAYATNSTGTVYGEERTFTTGDGLPQVTTGNVSSITATSAVCSGNVTSDGGVAVTARGICWNTVGNPDIESEHTTNGTGIGSFTANMTGLAPGATYHVRAYATNSTGTVYGEERTFTTGDGLPQVTTGNVSSITATSAVCSGNVTSDGGVTVTARGICWNTMGNPDTEGEHTANGTGTGSFTANLAGLTAGTTYHVRAYATNSTGTVYGAEQTFSTSTGSVSMTIESVTNITATSASCNVTITDDGGADVTERGICWSTSQYPTILGDYVIVGSGNGSYTASLGNLVPSTVYYVRAYARNITGTFYSNQMSFSTISAEPAINPFEVLSITASSIEGKYNVTLPAGVSLEDRGVCYSASFSLPELSDSYVSNGISLGQLTVTIENLSPSTTYHIRPYVRTEFGTYYGSSTTATTNNGLPMCATLGAGNVTATSAYCSGDVTSDGGFQIRERGFCWSTAPYPTMVGMHTTVGQGVGLFATTITNLSVSTTYYLRAYAINDNGTVYGEQVVFTTESGLPNVTTSMASLVGNTVTSGGIVTDDGGFPVTARGVCYGSTPNPDLSNSYSHTYDGEGIGTFISQFEKPNSASIFYVRAYATNSNGTVYGQQELAAIPYDTLPTFTYNGHVYKVAPDPGYTMNWNSAVSFGDNYAGYGYSDWYLPTQSELQSMCAQRSTIGGFERACYWTSEELNEYYSSCNPGVHPAVYVYFTNTSCTNGGACVEKNYRVRVIRLDH